MATPPLNPLVEKIRAKFPGAYDDMDDATLTKSVLAKYPGYADLAAPSPTSSVARPNVQMQTSALGQAVYGPPSNADEESLRASGYAGPSASQINPVTSSAAMAAGPAALAGSAGLAIPGARTAVKAIPTIAAMEGIGYLRHNAPFGKYIPPGAEWLPMFMGGKGEAEPAEKPPKDIGDPFRNVPKPAPPDVFNVKEPPATPSGFPRVSDTPSPYRMGPGEVAPESTAVPNPKVLAGNQGVRTTPIGALPPAPEPAAPAAERVPIQNAPYTMSGESTARQILGGFDNQTLLKIAKSRGIAVTAESQLKPTVANNRIIGKIVDDMKPEELEEIRSRYIESTRQPLPQGIGPEAYRTAAQSTYFPDLKVSKAKLGRMQKALAQRQP